MMQRVISGSSEQDVARVKTNFWTRGLDKLKGAFVHAPTDPASRNVAKKAEPSKAAAKRSSDSSTQSEASDASKGQDGKAAGKKIPAQPWYRHRQRW
jgi:hypothetical protein